MSTAVDTVASSKIWKPITIVGSIVALAALLLASKEIFEAKKTMAKKQKVKKGLEAVKAELTEPTEVVGEESTSNCAGCMSSASGVEYQKNDVNIINPSSLIPEVYS